MALILPKRLLAERQKRIVAPVVGCYVGYRDLTGDDVEIADAISQLVEYRRSDVIRNIAWLLSRAGSCCDERSQIELARFFLDEGLFAAFRKHLQSTSDRPCVLFHRQTLWFLLQLAVLCCRETPDEPNERALKEAIGRTCLIASDCLEQSSGCSRPEELPENDREDAWASIFLSIRDIDSHSIRFEMLARAQLFWLEIPAEARVRQVAKSLNINADFDEVFAAVHGVPLHTFVHVIVASYAFFLQQQEGNPRLLDPDEYFSTTGDPQAALRALAVVSRTPDAIAKTLVNEPRQSWSRDFTPLRQYPLVEVLPGKFACPDVSFLGNNLCYGVYHLLVKAFGKDGEKFRALFGYVFEEYINRLIEQFAYAGSVLARTYYPRPTFADKTEVADFIIHWGDTALFVECKAGQLSTRQKYAGLPNVLMKGIDDLLLRDDESGKRRRTKKGITQLVESIARVVRGEQVFGDKHAVGSAMDFSSCHIIPTLITFDEALGLQAIQRRVERKLQELLERKHIDPARIGPVLLLTIEDMELIQELQNVTAIKALFLDYAAYLEEGTTRLVGNFRDFAYNKFPDHSADRSLVLDTATRLFEDTISGLRISPAEAAKDENT